MNYKLYRSKASFITIGIVGLCNQRLRAAYLLSEIRTTAANRRI